MLAGATLAGALLAGVLAAALLAVAGVDPAGALALGADDDGPVEGVGWLLLCALLVQAAANRPTVTAMAAPFIRLIVLAPHCLCRRPSRPVGEWLTGLWCLRANRLLVHG